MSKARWVVAAAATGLAVLAAAVYLTSLGKNDGFIDPSADEGRITLGKTVYAANCAACHGANLQGQANWRERLANGRLPAPPHDKTGHTWHHPDGMLVDMVKNGLVPGKTAPPGYVSDMPAYRDILSDQEIIAVLAYIKSTWPPKVLQVQKEVTLQRQN